MCPFETILDAAFNNFGTKIIRLTQYLRQISLFGHTRIPFGHYVGTRALKGFNLAQVVSLSSIYNLRVN